MRSGSSTASPRGSMYVKSVCGADSGSWLIRGSKGCGRSIRMVSVWGWKVRVVLFLWSETWRLSVRSFVINEGMDMGVYILRLWRA